MRALDMAAWDLLAKSAGFSLTRFLGGEKKPIPAYHSLGNGWTGWGSTRSGRIVGVGFPVREV
jgi:L-alanine-DL-glutamate epimerase-like enolase superfamily enzyme